MQETLASCFPGVQRRSVQGSINLSLLAHLGGRQLSLSDSKLAEEQLKVTSPDTYIMRWL